MPMILRGNNGNEFELAFTRETVPETQDGFGDDTWATVNFRVATQEDEWEETAPCLNLFEFTNLAEWLEALAARKGDDDDVGEVSEVELLQPELKFSVTEQSGDQLTIRVWFHLSNRPEEFTVDASTDEAEFVDLHIAHQALGGIAASLRADLDRLAKPPKDDLQGESDSGAMGLPDDDLSMVDDVQANPPGAGEGEDNAGER